MSAANLAEMFGTDQLPETLPPNPAGAMLLALTYIRLGGSFSISNGKRYMGETLFISADEGLPQLPDAEPHEQFHCAREWRGAIKLLNGLIRRFDRGDRDAIYTLLASIAVDERKFVPTIAEPLRGVA